MISTRPLSECNTLRIFENTHPTMKQANRKTEGDRDIPSRAAMEKAGTQQTFSTPPPKTLFQRKLFQSQFPLYSPERTLVNQARSYTVDTTSPSARWQFPQKAFYMASSWGMSTDFYRNNIHWGKHLLGVNLGNECYVQNVKSKKTNRVLINVSEFASLRWSPSGTKLACGDVDASLILMDLEKNQVSSKTFLDGEPLYSMEWGSDENQLFIGSVDQVILHDERASGGPVGHFILADSDVICSMRLNREKSLLAIGNNTNHVQIFDTRNMHNGPIQSYSHHASIKALQWVSSTQVLSGGGTEDRMLKLWDTRLGKVLSETDTGSQICGIECLDSDYYVLGMGYGDSHNIQLWRKLPRQHKLQMVDHIKEPGGRILDVVKNPNPDSSEICSHSEVGILSFWKFERLLTDQKNNPHSNEQPFSHLKTIR